MRGPLATTQSSSALVPQPRMRETGFPHKQINEQDALEGHSAARMGAGGFSEGVVLGPMMEK